MCSYTSKSRSGYLDILIIRDCTTRLRLSSYYRDLGRLESQLASSKMNLSPNEFYSIFDQDDKPPAPSSHPRTALLFGTTDGNTIINLPRTLDNSVLDAQIREMLAKNFEESREAAGNEKPTVHGPPPENRVGAPILFSPNQRAGPSGKKNKSTKKNNSNKSATPRTPKFTWNSPQVTALIYAVKKRYSKIMKHGRFSQSQWQPVADTLNKVGIQVTWGQCLTKWRNLEQAYRKVVDNKERKTGTGVAGMDNYDLLHDILSYRATTTLPFLEGSLVEEDSGTGIIQEKVGNKKRCKSIVHDQDQNSDLEGAMGESILDATSDDGEEESEPSCGSDLECENEEKDDS